MGYEDWEDYASETGAGEEDSKGCSAVVIEPSGGAGDGCKQRFSMAVDSEG